jgi:hypothetical protein
VSSFRGGPADGQTLTNGRQPRFLRIVTSGAKVDCLDQLDDVAAPDESIAVYRLVDAGHYARVRVARPVTCIDFWTGLYEHVADVDGELVRDNEAWREWCRAQPHPRLEEALP